MIPKITEAHIRHHRECVETSDTCTVCGQVEALLRVLSSGSHRVIAVEEIEELKQELASGSGETLVLRQRIGAIVRGWQSE